MTPTIDANALDALLERRQDASPARIREILAKARQMRGIGRDEALTLMAVTDPELSAEIFAVGHARSIRDGASRRLNATMAVFSGAITFIINPWN